MTDAIFVTVDGGGNLPPALALASRMRERGGRIRFVGTEVQRERVETHGFRFRAIDGWADYDASRARSTWESLTELSRLFADRSFARTAVDEMRAERADVVVMDTLLSGAIEEALAAGLPVVQLVHMFPTFAEKNGRGVFAAFLRARGAHPRRALKAPGLSIAATRGDFEGREVPGIRHAGFFWQGVPSQARAGAVPRVLVSFSTTAFPDQPAALQRTIDGLGDLSVEVVVTTGPSIDPASLRPAANTTIHRHLDHAEVLPATSLVVGHGGHSTAARALSYGVPLLVLPMHPLMDQPLVGKAIAARGVGATISRTSSAGRIRDAVAALLADEQVQANARRLGASIRERDGAVIAADMIEGWLGSR